MPPDIQNNQPLTNVISNNRESAKNLVSQDRPLFLAAVLTFFFLGILTPLQLFSSAPAGWASKEFVLCAFILLLSTIRIAMLASRKPRFMALTFYFFIYIWVGWSGSLHAYTGNFPWPHVHNSENLTAALIMVLLGMAMYEIGRIWSARFLAAHAKHRALNSTRFDISFKRLIALWLFSFVGFAYGLAFFGVGGVLGTRAGFMAGVSGNVTGIDLIAASSLLRVPCFITFLATIVLIKSRWHFLSLRQRRLLGLMFVTAAILTAIANYPPALARWWLGTIGFTLLFLLTPWTRKSSLVWVLLLTFILTWAFPRADLFRKTHSFSQAIETLQSQESFRKHVNSVDYDVLQMIANTHVYTVKEGFNWGESFLGAALFYVPRAIWTAKPQRSDLVIARGIHYKQSNLSVPLWAESYLAFGWFGVFFVFLIYGYWSNRLDTAFALNMSNDPRIAIGTTYLLLPFLAAYQFTLLRGNLLTCVAYGTPAVLAIIFLFRRELVPTHAKP